MEDCDVDADVDVRDPDEKSIMTYVAQFLQYSRDLPVAEEDTQVCIVLSHIQQLSFHTVFTVFTHVKTRFTSSLHVYFTLFL